MRQPLPVIFIVLGLLATIPATASSIHYDKADKYVKAAHVIAVVKLIKVERQRTKCELRVTMFYRALRFIKGSLPKGLLLQYTVQHYLYRKGCPSVHYRLPPSGGSKQESIATINRAGNHYQITSTYNISDLPKIKRLLK